MSRLSELECMMLTGLRGFSLLKLEQIGLFPKHQVDAQNKPTWLKEEVVEWLKGREKTLPKNINTKSTGMKNNFSQFRRNINDVGR